MTLPATTTMHASKLPHVGGVTIDTATEPCNAILQRLPWTSSRSNGGVWRPFLSYSSYLFQRSISEFPWRHQIWTKSRSFLVSDLVFILLIILILLSGMNCCVSSHWLLIYSLVCSLKLVEVKHVKINFLLWKDIYLLVLNHEKSEQMFFS